MCRAAFFTPAARSVEKKGKYNDFPLFLETWSGRRVSNSRPQPWQVCALPTELLPQRIKHVRNKRSAGAGDESRTRDLNLGKVALYQLSYSRAEEMNYVGLHRLCQVLVCLPACPVLHMPSSFLLQFQTRSQRPARKLGLAVMTSLQLLAPTPRPSSKDRPAGHLRWSSRCPCKSARPSAHEHSPDAFPASADRAGSKSRSLDCHLRHAASGCRHFLLPVHDRTAASAHPLSAGSFPSVFPGASGRGMPPPRRHPPPLHALRLRPVASVRMDDGSRDGRLRPDRLTDSLKKREPSEDDSLSVFSFRTAFHPSISR